MHDIRLMSPDDGLNGTARPAETRRDLVEELAEALNRSSSSEHRASLTTSMVPSFAGALLPAGAVGHDFDDDYPDDPPLPIPSTWHASNFSSEPSWLSEQFRAAGFGFGAGLLVVVPTVLLLTGRIGLPTVEPATLASTSLAAKREVIEVAVDPKPALNAGSETGPRLRTVMTTTVPVTPPAAAPAQAAAEDTAELRGEGARRIAAGDIVGARDVLGRAVAAGDAAALLALGETFDPNMLAAWSARSAAPDVTAARNYYGRALAAGITKARMRLEALN